MGEVLNTSRELYPGVSRLLPNGDGRGREVGVIECPDSDAEAIRSQVKGPAHRASTGRAEVVAELTGVLRIAGIDPVLALKLDF